MVKRRRLRKSGGGELEVNMQDVATSDEAILLPYVGGGDEGVVESQYSGSEGQGMDACWVQMEVQSWQLHNCILCEMAVDQALEGGAWLGGRKVQTWEAFNCCRRSSTTRPCQDECSHLGKCDCCA